MTNRYFIYSAILEVLALIPLAVGGIGHAGPEGGIFTWISFLVNLPGVAFVLWLSTYFDFSWPKFIVGVFMFQITLLWFIGFVVKSIRRKQALR